MKSYTYTIGASYRRGFMVRLDELDIPYTEHRTMFNSTIVVKTYTEAHEDAYFEFELDFEDFERRLALRVLEREQRKIAEKRAEEAALLVRKNRFRRLTFRQPLTSLPR